jgi:hypothetical protein
VGFPVFGELVEVGIEVLEHHVEAVTLPNDLQEGVGVSAPSRVDMRGSRRSDCTEVDSGRRFKAGAGPG